MGATIRNDSSISVEEVMVILKNDSIELSYGKIMMKAERHVFEEAVTFVQNHTPAERQKMQISIDLALRKALPKLERGRFSKKVADNFHADLLLWEALKADRS